MILCKIFGHRFELNKQYYRNWMGNKYDMQELRCARCDELKCQHIRC